MSGFLYFIAGHQTALSPAEFTRLGLAYTTDDGQPPYNAELGLGPSGGPGWLVADTRRLGNWQPVYRPDEQTWRKRPGDGGPDVWVGYYNAAPPTRQTLERPAVIAGYAIELGDGEAWTVPLVRHVIGQPAASDYALPRYIDLDDLGQPIAGEVVREHRELVAVVDPFWEAWLAGLADAVARGTTTFTIDLPDVHARAARVLQTNYALGLVECVLLQLFRSDYGAADVLRAACDTDRACLALMEKKTTLDALGGGSWPAPAGAPA